MMYRIQRRGCIVGFTTHAPEHHFKRMHEMGVWGTTLVRV